jgi:signal transduction histidine kinase
MSLRARLVLLTLLLVALVVVSLSALQLQTLVDMVSENIGEEAERVGREAGQYIQQRILIQAFTGENDDQIRQQWTDFVSTDLEIVRYLRRAPLSGKSVQEINVADVYGHVLTSSMPNAAGSLLRPKEPFSEWRKLPWYRRVLDLVNRRPNWEIASPQIGIGETGTAVIKIQVITSSFLAQDRLTGPLYRLAFISSSALLIALVIALIATQSALRPLHRIERTIDRIAQGNFQAGESRPSLGKEFEAVESKLDLLGQRMLGTQPPLATNDQKLEALVENVARQFDVAQRLSAISRLSSGVAHEIKNPLNAILLRLDLLKVRLGESDEEVSEELNVLSKEVLRLNRVVTTFLDVSRPVEVHFEDVDLAALASEVTELVRPQATLGNINIEYTAPDQPAPMRGDPDLLKQAILNLVTNAVEAMNASGGTLRVSVERQDDNWILEVADTGPGIPPELREKVFQLYFTSKAKGSGIGLAMTYRAAQLHNGSIRFVSETGRGTTFRLEFPVAVSHA